MAAIVCHGLQSCLESQIVETRATLRLSLPFSKSLTPPPQPLDLSFKSTFWDNSNSKTQRPDESNTTKFDTLNDKGGWSFLQVLSNVGHGGPKEASEKDNVYIHPQVKRSSLKLSEKSLELCTENLGNETGSDNVGNNSIELLCSSSSSSSSEDSPTREQTRVSRIGLGEKKAKAREFPPPLTTIRGSESLRVRTHRENGRLVIEAVKVTSSASFFKAERSHGRLRLRLLKNHSPTFDYEYEEEEEAESERNDGEHGREDEAEQEQEEQECERGRRCKEEENYENSELFNWEQVWVTTTT